MENLLAWLIIIAVTAIFMWIAQAIYIKVIEILFKKKQDKDQTEYEKE